MAQPIESLYSTLTSNGYDLGDLKTFSQKMQDPGKAKILHDTIVNDGYDVGNFNSFSSKLGIQGSGVRSAEKRNFMFEGVPQTETRNEERGTSEPQMGTQETVKTLYGNVPGTTKIGDVSILPIGGNYKNTKGKAAIQALPSEKEVAVPAQSLYGDAPQVKPQTTTFDPIKDNLPAPTEYEKAMFDQAQGISKRVEDQSFNPKFYKDLAQGAINSTAGIGGSALKGAGDLYSKLGKLTSIDFYDNYGKTLQDLGEKATNYTRKNSNESAGQRIGGIVPLAGATVADIATGGALTPAITGAFAVSGYGDGLNMYDELNKGKENNEFARTGAGLLYGAVMAGATNYLVGKAIPKGILSDAVASVFKANPELLQSGGEAVINSFAKAQPTITKQLIKNTVHGVGTMEAMELSKNAIDEIYGKHHDLKDWINTAAQAAVTYAMFSAFTSPISIKAQSAATNARRESQGKVTLTFDENGKPVEVLSGNKGLTPDGKEVTIPEKNLNNAYTLTTEDFNNAIQQHKTEGKATINDRNVFSNNTADTLNKLSKNGTVSVARDENGESLYVIGGGANGYKAMNLKGEIVDIPQETPLESAHVADIHKSIMSEYDKRSKEGDNEDTGDGGKVGSGELVVGRNTDPEEIVNPILPDQVNVVDPNTHIQAGINTIQAQQAMEQSLKGTGFTFDTKMAEKDPETQKTILSEVMADGTLSDPQKQSIANFMQQASVSRKLHEARQETINNQLQQTRENLTKQVNDKTGTLVTGTIKGDDKPIQIIKGLAVTTDETKPDNPIIADPANSDEAVYYVDENGEHQVTTPDQLDVQSSIGIDDHMNSLQAQAMQEEEMQQQLIASNIEHQALSKENTVDNVIGGDTGTANYTHGEFVRLNDGTYGTIAGKTADGYELESDNGTVRDINETDIIPEPQLKGIGSGDTVDYIDENGDQQTGIIQIDPTLRKQGKVFVNDVEIPIENIVKEPLTPKVEQEGVSSGESIVGSNENVIGSEEGDNGDVGDSGQQNTLRDTASVTQYPIQKDGTPDFEKMNDEQTFNYLKETEGEEGAVSAIKSVIKNTQNEIQSNQRAIDKFNSTKHTRQNKATTLQEIAGIKASLKSEESKLNDKRDELQRKLQGLQGLVGSSESVVGSREKEPQAPKGDVKKEDSSESVIGSKENAVVGSSESEVGSKENTRDNGDSGDIVVNTVADNTPSIEVREKDKAKQMNPWEKRLNNLGDYVDLEDYILRAIAGGVKFKWTGNGTNKGLGDELGLASSDQERNLRKSIIGDNGMTPQKFAHTIWDEYGGENNQGRIPGMDKLESQDVMNFVLDVANSTHTKNEALTKAEEKHDNLGLSPEDYDVYTSFTPEELNYLEALPDDILESYLGITDFTPEQLDIINNLQNEYGNTNTESTDTSAGERGEGTESIEHRASSIESGIASIEHRASSVESKKSGINEQIARQEVNENPTEAQKEAGNYKKGHIVINGMDISVENPVGSLRKGVDRDGTEWEHEMKSHYGYFKGTVGKDGDHVDVFTKSNTPEDYNGPVYVIDQTAPSNSPQGGEQDGEEEKPKFDESKVMLGFDSPEEAKLAYLENYDKDWKGFSAITEIGVEDFKKWLYDGKKQHKPFSEYVENQTPNTKHHQEENRGTVETVVTGTEKGMPLYHTGKTMQPSNQEEVKALTEQLFKTGLARDVKMVTPEEITGILEGNEQLHKYREDKSGNEIGDGSWNVQESVYNFDQYPQIKIRVDKSETTETTYVKYTNEENGKSITVRFSNHENNATKFGDQLDGNLATGDQILFHLGLKTREFVPDKYLSIWTTQVSKKDLSHYEQADKTIQELYALGANTDISSYKGKLAKGSNYLILGDKVKEESKTKLNIFGQNVEVGQFNYRDVQFLRTPSGTIYGFVKNGVVYLNSDKPNLNTPVHEFGHLWIDGIEQENKGLFDKGVELVKETPYWEKVNADPNYSHLSDNDRAKEAMASAIGDKGEQVKQNLGLFARLKAWIHDVWERIGAKFGIKNLTPEQIQDLTFEDFTDIGVNELMSGEPLTPKGGQEKKLPDTIEVEGIERTTTDSTGKPIHLTEDGVRNFWKWFGDSKVVDEHGRPLMVYHGTNTDFNEFKIMDSDIFGTKLGHFFTPDKNIANIFADGKVHEAYLSIKNPKEIKGSIFDKYEQYKGADAKLRKLAPKDIKYDIVTLPDFKTYRETLQQEGYDGIVLNNFSTKKTIQKVPQYIAFESDQIKSATGNDGSFDPNNGDIRYQVIGEQGAGELDKAEESTTRLDNLKVAREMEAAFEEKKAKIEKLRNSDPIEITGTEIKQGKDLKEYRKNAFEYGKNLRGEYKNEDTGAEIKVSRGSIEEVLKHSILDDGHIQSVAAIPQIIEKSTYIDTLDNDDPTKHPDVKSYSYYVAGLRINGEDYTVKAVVAESKSGERYYDHKLTKIEKGKLLSTLPDIHKSGEESNVPFSDSKDKRLLSILQTNDVKSAQDIRLATGWEKGVDGKWRYEPLTFKGEQEKERPQYTKEEPEKPKYRAEKPLGQYAAEIHAYNEQLKAIDQRKKDLKTEHDYKQISNTEFVTRAKKLNAEKFDIETKVKRIEAGTSRPEDFEIVGSKEKVVGSEENKIVGSNESVVGSKENTVGSNESLVGSKENNGDNADGGDTGIVGSGENTVGSSESVVGSKGNVGSGNGKPPKTTSMATKLASEAGEDLPGRLRDELDEKMERGLSKLRFAVQEAYQDQHLAVKLFQDKLAENGLKITPINDWYMRATALGGMNDSQMDAYEHRFNLPIMKEVNRMEKISSYRDIENYLMLKHGLERNEFMRAQEAAALEAEGKNIPEGLSEKDFSGITAIEEETEMPAQEFINEFEAKDDTKKLWQLINKSTDNTLKVQYENGLIDKETYVDLTTRSKYYVPLRGFDKDIAEDKYDYSPDMGTHFVAPLIKAKGRTSRPETPFAYIFSMNHSSITQGNKNNLNQIWVRLARQDKSGLLILKQSWYKKTGVSDDGLPIWEQQSPEWNADPEQYDQNIQKFEADMADLAEKGEAMQKRGKLNIGLFVKPKQAKQHEIHVYENGTEHVVYINANPKIARAINGDNRVEAGAFFDGLSVVNRWMAANFTSRNPLFMVTNFERDITFATTTLGVKEGIVYQAKFIRNIPAAVKAITNMTLGKGNVEGKYDQYANEFIMNGGKTGYTHIVEIKSVQKRIEAEIKKGKIHEPSVVFRAFELGNLVAENTTRLATYITSREMGRDIAESVSNAKEVTVNFNRKGSGALGADAMRKSFLFFNVAVQALDNMIKTTKGHPYRMAGLLASFVASGLLAPMLTLLLGGDEAETAYNNLSDYDRHNNWCIWTGDGFVKWALPQELRVFHALGDNIYRHSKGKVTNTELAVNTMVGLTDLLPLNPLGAMATEDKEWKMLANTATPDLMKPWVQLAMNVTYTGGSAYNQFANKADPGYEQASKNKKGEPFAPAILVWASQETDKLSGGDGVMPGKASPNPDIINHLMRGYMGGLYTIFIKSVDSGDKLIEGKELKVRDTPLSTLYTSKDDISANNAAMRKEYNDIKAAVKDEKHYITKYKEKAKDVYRETGDLSKTAEYINKMTSLSTKKFIAIKTLTNGITKLEGEMEDAPNADELQKKANEFKKMVIGIDKAGSDEEVEKIVGNP